jgi:hypothetical protein
MANGNKLKIIIIIRRSQVAQSPKWQDFEKNKKRTHGFSNPIFKRLEKNISRGKSAQVGNWAICSGQWASGESCIHLSCF